MAGQDPAITFCKIHMKYIFLVIMPCFVARAMQHSVIMHIVNNTPMTVRLQHIGREQIFCVPGMESEHYYVTPQKNSEIYQFHLKLSGDYFRAAFFAYTVYEKKQKIVIKKQLVRDSKKIKYTVQGHVYQEQKQKFPHGTLEPQVITLIINNNQKPLLGVGSRLTFVPEVIL
jgi:hypothetical protein